MLRYAVARRTLVHGMPLRTQAAVYSRRSTGMTRENVEGESLQPMTLPSTRYERLVKNGVIERSAAQEQLLHRFDQLAEEVVGHHAIMRKYWDDVRVWRREHAERLQQRLAELHERKGKRGMFGELKARLTNLRTSEENALIEHERKRAMETKPPVPTPVRGAYIHGGVGSGKTMCMDLLYASISPVLGTGVRRLHAHALLLEVYEAMHRFRVQDDAARARGAGTGRSELMMAELYEHDATTVGHVLDAVAIRLLSSGRMALHNAVAVEENILGDGMKLPLDHHKDAGLDDRMAGRRQSVAGSEWEPGTLLCFDEFAVTDVGDAALLRGVLERLWGTGVVVVATSNRAVEDLNKDGLQMRLWEGFLSKMDVHCQSVLLESGVDYRKEALKHDMRSGQGMKDPFFPPGSPAPDTHALLREMGAELLFVRDLQQWHDDNGRPEPGTIGVMFGRTLHVPLQYRGIACFDFEELCCRAVGNADYISLASAFHTAVLLNVPRMDMGQRAAARRFLSLIDQLYNHRVRLVLHAEVEPEFLFDATTGEQHFAGMELDAEEKPTGIDQLGVMSSVPDAVEREGGRYLFTGEEEVFAFDRVVSRLREMRTVRYQMASMAHHGIAAG